MPVSILVQHNYRGKLNQNGRYPVHLYVIKDTEREKLYLVKLPQKPVISEWQDKPDA